MPMLDSLERRFGRFAIRGLVGYIAFFQALVFVVMYSNPAFFTKLILVPFTEMDGEWWRLVSFLAVPDARGPIVFFLTIYVGLLCAARAEAEMGAFRMNLFVGLYVVLQWAQAAVAGTDPGRTIMSATGAWLMPVSADGVFFLSSILFTNLFFVFAVLEPKYTFWVFGVVPLSARVLALLDAGSIGFGLMRTPQMWLVTLLSLAPFLCFATPMTIAHLRHRSRVGSRRSRFKANSLAVEESFHKCSVCGRTDASDPELDFRITDDGTEYCAEHLPRE